MMDKVWVIYREEDMDNVKIYDDKVYINENSARECAKELNKSNILNRYYVDYLDVDYN